MFHADGRTARRDEVNSRFSQFCKRASKLFGQSGAERQFLQLYEFLVRRIIFHIWPKTPVNKTVILFPL
jgi:hypothetical protein